MQIDPDQWVVGTWHAYYGVELHCVIEKDGAPQASFHPSSDSYSWYKWNSYAAARKWLRENPAKEGYVIVNLTAIKKQCAAARERGEARRKATAAVIGVNSGNQPPHSSN